MEQLIFPLWPALDQILSGLQTEGILLVIVGLVSFFLLLRVGFMFITLIRKLQRYQFAQQQLVEYMRRSQLQGLYLLEGREFFKGLVRFLETYGVVGAYSTISDVLQLLGCSLQEVRRIEGIVYHQEYSDPQLESSLKSTLKNFQDS